MFVGPDRRLATAWISAWDTEKDAEELEATLGQGAACWRENALGLGRGDYTIGAKSPPTGGASSSRSPQTVRRAGQGCSRKSAW
ncbi:uncharacterized protein SOCE26_014660 [Sorangium cellulosum]|uniref:Uncharacterized protein n=1 Tax=Sorangium cellulosum TaxID=56 RepID=A0A2L0ELA7_SORCE|nr:uncharacterized protein SOCE26_014660 [Sorangium cellulosum]